MIVKRTPDTEKALSLLHTAEITLERLAFMPQEAYPSNTLVDYYDSIHKLLDATASCEGIKHQGEGAHKELIEWATQYLCLKEEEHQLLQEMRTYRNRITYEGFMISAEYISTRKKEILNIITQLKKYLLKTV